VDPGVPGTASFCLAEKKAARFAVYQWTARFQAALMPEYPENLTLVPGEAGRTDATHRPRIGWDADGRLHLGPPILQFTVDELLDDQRYELFGSILDYWVVNDLRNLLRQQMGMRSASGPARVLLPAVVQVYSDAAVLARPDHLVEVPGQVPHVQLGCALMPHVCSS
jgi:hypothetical protein